MKFTKVQETIQRTLPIIQQKFSMLEPIVTAIDDAGGRSLLIGGAVRDCILSREIKDLDIEVHGLSLEQLETLLRRFGHVRLVGKSFGVLRIDGISIDWSIPRTDSAGRFPTVTLDPHMSVYQACKRRDLTMNAMVIDLKTGQLEDPFEGLKALEEGVLKTPDTALFVEDPLRFYRIMQFIGRFEMMPDQELDTVAKTMDISSVSQERIVQEFEKLFLLAKRPSLAFHWLLKIGRLKELLPELYATCNVPQEPSYHPEGDVFEHSLQALDCAAQQEYSSTTERLVMVLASLCHDLGKPEATKIVEGRWRSFGHDVMGVVPAEKLLDRLTHTLHLKKPILKLVRHHMDPVAFVKGGAKGPAYKRLASALAPHTTLTELTRLAVCDKSGRNPEKGCPLVVCPEPLIEEFLKKAQNYGVADGIELPLLTGADCMPDVPAGPALGALLKRAYEIQIEEGITDKNELKKRVLKGK